ncbi:DEAD/DEAH box helicase [soil metagenome]
MRPHLTFLPDATRPAAGRLVLYTPSGADLAACEALAATLQLTGAQPAEIDLAVPRGGVIAVDRMPVLQVPVADAVDAMLAASTVRHANPTVRTWTLATRLALTAVASHRLMPHLVMAGEAINGLWRVDLDGDPALTAALDRLVEAAPAAATAPALDQTHAWHPHALLSAYLDAVADTVVRRSAPPPSGRPRQRLLPWTTRWAEALGDPEDPVVPLREDGPDLAAAIEGWQARTDADASLVLTLTAPDDPAQRWTLSFALRDEDDVTHEGPDVWLDPAAGFAEALLAGLSRAARVFPPLDAALASESPTEISLSLDEAWQFIAEAAPLLTGSGVTVTLPATLAEDGIAAQIRLDTTEEGLVNAVWEVSLDDRVLTDEEIGDFLQADDPLGFYGGRWVKIDEETRAALLARGRRETIGQAEALALALAGTTSDDWFGEGTAAGRVVVDDVLSGLLDAIRNAGSLEDVAETPEGFEGELRPYQQRGVAWLRGMADLGMGAVLADAMGLGKTIQLIGLLVSRPGPFLVVCPTSVVGNWEREINRFGPALPVTRYHGPDRPIELGDVEGVVVTSYGTLRRDIEMLGEIKWDIVTLDEAQQVKNPSTAAAQAVRRLQSGSVFALTGTPLENRLAELWSVIDATNRGLLGTRGMFTKRFVGPVEVRHDPAAASRLRRLVSPFIMRRTKDDPEVAKDLPDKIERTVVCSLTPEQADLYAKVTEQSLKALVDTDGIGRRGRILALLTALKQVTNHPAQYLKQPGPIADRSGKLGALREIAEAVTDAGDSMLIFTQFTRMGDLLTAQLEEDLGMPVPFLHGGLSVNQRDAMVEEFQQGGGSPILVISTRAGGTGLNLTAATHVVHYDRWWNPAVEDQATDRAHRIGQTRTVEVHKLVTAGTLEERIAEMLDRKRALADAVVGAGETWITELDDDALAELVRLSVDAPLTEPDDRVGVGVG